VVGIPYLIWQLLLIVISLFSICRGTDGGWVVTQRAGGGDTSHFGVPMNVDTTPLVVDGEVEDLKGLRQTFSGVGAEGLVPLLASAARLANDGAADDPEHGGYQPFEAPGTSAAGGGGGASGVPQTPALQPM